MEGVNQARRAEVGVIGGSGLYRLLEQVEEAEVETPFGPPSDRIAIGEVAGVPVAFLPRHGGRHELPPAAINYRANLWALRSLGVTRVIAPAAVGGLRADLRPGHIVICDQFVDRTWGRADTFHAEGPVVAHAGMADPYCPELRGLAAEVCRQEGAEVSDSGTVVVIQGPRFSSRAESRWFAAMGWDVVNMTQYPEVALARELELCYVNISLVTDHDAGLEGRPGMAPVTVAEVERVFGESIERIRRILLEMVTRIPAERGCGCGSAMRGAVVGR